MKQKSTKRKSPLKGRSRRNATDWPRVRTLTDAQIARAAASDPDSFMPDTRWMKNARIVMPQTKEVVTLRLDPAVMAWFRKDGKGYQTRINAVLRSFVESR